MNFAGFIKNVIKQLNELNADYAITGALAVSYYGRPRTTVDVDVIIKTTPADFPKLIEYLRKAGLVCELSDFTKAWESKYRIVTLRSRKGYQLDLILTREDIAKRRVKILGLQAYVQEPGPLLLEKLRLLKNTTDEEKRVIDRMDILSILKNVEDIDMKVLKDKAKEQATFDILEELLTQAEAE